MKNIILCAVLITALYLFINPVRIFSQVTDKDGNVYKTVTIGKQEWTSENLTVEHYRNGDAIPQVPDYDKWAKLTEDAWCWYDNSTANGKSYGKLYNWYAVNDKRGLAPEGWHVATVEDWKQLTDFLGGDKTAGEKIKNSTGWFENGNGTNETGFSALPGGIRDADGSFYDIFKFGCFWSSTEKVNTSAWYFFVVHNFIVVAQFDGAKERGLSVRLVKD